MPHRHQRHLALVYIAPLGFWIVWVTFLLAARKMHPKFGVRPFLFSAVPRRIYFNRHIRRRHRPRRGI
jgi:hypothetical protein